MALMIYLAITGMFLRPDFVPSGESMSLSQCVHSCYFDTSCAGLFYKREEGVCYQTTFPYKLDQSKKKFIDDKSEYEAYLYYEWTSDACSNNGWIYHRQTKTCLKLFTNELSHDDAGIQCSLLNDSKLISIRGDEKIQFARMFAEIKAEDFWTSGEEISEGVWEWKNGDKITKPDWKDGEPGDKKCIMVRKEGDGWEDKQCSDDVEYVCERNVVSTYENCVSQTIILN